MLTLSKEAFAKGLVHLGTLVGAPPDRATLASYYHELRGRLDEPMWMETVSALAASHEGYGLPKIPVILAAASRTRAGRVRRALAILRRLDLHGDDLNGPRIQSFVSTCLRLEGVDPAIVRGVQKVGLAALRYDEPVVAYRALLAAVGDHGSPLLASLDGQLSLSPGGAS